MVVNGGYPASLSCRAASIAWRMAGLRPLSIHNFHNFAQATPLWRRWIDDVIDFALLRSSLAMVSVSSVCLASLHLRSQFRKRGAYKFIHNGIEPIDAGAVSERATKVRGELAIPRDAPLCLMLATFEPRKGHEFFLRAFRQVIGRMPGARALICGHGSASEVARVRQLLTTLGLDGHVILHDYRRDIAALLANAQLMVVPSQAFESFGLVIVEAMAMRVPVVATRIGGIPEVMPDGMGGLLCDAQDVEGFSHAILRVLAAPQFAATLAARGYDRYKARFTAEKMAGEYAKLLRAQRATDLSDLVPVMQAEI